jgi:hypothetical protein
MEKRAFKSFLYIDPKLLSRTALEITNMAKVVCWRTGISQKQTPKCHFTFPRDGTKAIIIESARIEG